ncbi:uncharacterized protein LOC127729721 isoform X1 [Mytilus californianus]|uniref:uncharacterized protein LOC127729721 isoform X1 n=1 Tax=Mytilus californianus TaxID=6549 RepID=UPI0022481C33|nr:uncharacterized protein LOC127729721 isoform X1 [Mytilus californianus]
MATTDTDSVHDHMTRLRMKMVNQKIANEREKLNRPSSTESANDVDEQLRLQQAMLRRQELLDKIRREQIVNHTSVADNRRPRSYSARRRYTPSPVQPPPSRRSLPDFNRNNGDYTYRERDNYQQPFYGDNNDMSQVKHVIKHTIATPRQYHLPPIMNAPQQPIIQQQQPSPLQHIIQQVPVPQVTYQNLVPDNNQQKSSSMFNKGDFMDMMMVQHQQVNQLVMQQLMMQQFGGRNRHSYPCYPSYYYAEPAQPVLMARPGGGQVHHHHYSMTPAPMAAPMQQPVVHHYQPLPPLEGRMMSPARAITERRMAPAQTRVAEPRARSLSPPPVAAKRSNQGNRPSSVFLFGIILKEIVAALHRIYLNPSGNIYPVLADIISPKAYDLTNLLRGRTNERETQVMIQELQYVVENLVYHMTEIMPSTGVLGTHRKSAVYELIKDGKRFPDGYFWQVELDRLQFTENGRTAGVGDPEGFLLIVGIYISRSLITTLLMKPVDYGLSSQQLSDIAERNLKILATTLLYLVRRVSGSRGRAMMPMPSEISKYLYTDEEMRPVYGKMAKSFNYAEGLLREWGQEYMKRLRAAPVPK